MNTLSVSEARYFKPSPSAFERVRGRGKDAWLIRPGSYFLLPFRQAFAREFPPDFAILLTLRPTEESEVSELKSFESCGKSPLVSDSQSRQPA